MSRCAGRDLGGRRRRTPHAHTDEPKEIEEANPLHQIVPLDLRRDVNPGTPTEQQQLRINRDVAQTATTVLQWG